MQNSKLSPFYSFINYFSYLRNKRPHTRSAGKPGVIPINNVKYSDWITLNMKFSMLSNLYEQIITTALINEAIIHTSIILTFIRCCTFTGPIQTVRASTCMEEVFSEDGIELISDRDYSGFIYRYIIIPFSIRGENGLPAEIQSYTKEQLQEMNYDEVMKLLYQS